MAKLDKVASRYAKAFLDFLGDGAKAKEAAAELQAFGRLLSENADLGRALTTEVFSTDKRTALVKDIAEKAKVSEPVKKFLVVLAENKRIASVEEIAERLHTLYLEKSEVEPIIVETAVSLSDGEKSQVEKKFSEILGRKVEAKYILQNQLLGGLKVSASGRTYDGTLSGWLENLEEKLIGGRV